MTRRYRLVLDNGDTLVVDADIDGNQLSAGSFLFLDAVLYQQNGADFEAPQPKIAIRRDSISYIFLPN